MYIVTSYDSPDLDGYGCAVAYAELLRALGGEATARIIGPINEETRYLIDRFHLSEPILWVEHPVDPVVLVDSSESKYFSTVVDLNQVIEIIDHRMDNDAHLFRNAKVQIEAVGAAATLVAERFRSAGVTPSFESAVLLYGGIISNTLNFLSTNHTSRDKEMAIWLKSLANLSNDLPNDMFVAKSDLLGGKLKGAIEGDTSDCLFGTRRIGIAQLEIVNSERLIAERQSDIEQVLEGLKKSEGFESIFLSINDLGANHNFFLTKDDSLVPALETVLDVKFNGGLAKREGHIMRKQIVPKLRTFLESNR